MPVVLDPCLSVRGTAERAMTSCRPVCGGDEAVLRRWSPMLHHGGTVTVPLARAVPDVHRPVREPQGARHRRRLVPHPHCVPRRTEP